jgi:plexin A
MGEFDSLAGLKELYIYVYKYYGEIMEALEDNFVCKKMGLQHKLKSIVLSVNPGQL